MSTLPRRSPSEYGDRWPAGMIRSTRRRRNASTFSFNGFSRKSSTGRSRGKPPRIKINLLIENTHRNDKKANYAAEIADITLLIHRLACHQPPHTFQPGGRHTVSGSPASADKVGSDQVQRSRRRRSDQSNERAGRRC